METTTTTTTTTWPQGPEGQYLSSNFPVTWVPEENEKEASAEKILERIMFENFPRLGKDKIHQFKKLSEPQTG